tara:strand:- start:46 stop:234 length:189 start_codon:yes stop_codon:yes gene_type:complete
MIYKHAKWGEDKVFSISANPAGTTIVKEYVRQCKKSELVIPDYQIESFVQRLIKDGWEEQKR